jgi:hypothetical protein
MTIAAKGVIGDDCSLLALMAAPISCSAGGPLDPMGRRWLCADPCMRGRPWADIIALYPLGAAGPLPGQGGARASRRSERARVLQRNRKC